jgi:glutathione synthase/RimK-type ligase-like ATP-grasp enzyme
MTAGAQEDAPLTESWLLSLEILRQACRETGDAFEILDPASRFLARVTRAGRSFVASAGLSTIYPLNSHAAAELARDKAYCVDVLASAGLAVVPGARFYADAADASRFSQGQSPADALAWAEWRGYPFFAKLNRGAHGKLARRIGSANALLAYLAEARAFDHMVLLQPIVEAPEARVFIVEGRARFVYRRTPMTLRGDGQRSIGALLASHLADPRLAAEPTALEAAATALARLAKDRRALGDIPGPSEPVLVAEAANLAQGGRLEALDLDPGPELQAWARRVAEASGLRIFGADVFYERLEDPSSFQVIELNGNPSLAGLWRAGHRDVCLAIWRDVLDAQFA